MESVKGAAQEPVFSEFADDPDFRELLELFADAIPEKRQALQESFASNRIDDLQTTAHQIKGAGGGYGFSELSHVAYELELACKAGDVDRVGESLDVLLGYMDRIRV